VPLRWLRLSGSSHLKSSRHNVRKLARPWGRENLLCLGFFLALGVLLGLGRLVRIGVWLRGRGLLLS